MWRDVYRVFFNIKTEEWLHVFRKTVYCTFLLYLLGTITNCLELFRICLEEYCRSDWGVSICKSDILLYFYYSTVYFSIVLLYCYATCHKNFLRD